MKKTIIAMMMIILATITTMAYSPNPSLLISGNSYDKTSLVNVSWNRPNPIETDGHYALVCICDQYDYDNVYLPSSCTFSTFCLNDCWDITIEFQSDNSKLLDFSAFPDGNYRMCIHSESNTEYYDSTTDTGGSDIPFVLYTPISCTENWTASYTTCDVFDEQMLLYTDENACGTYDDLPIDNGTISSCNYCSIVITNSTSSCFEGSQVLSFTNTNYGSCCALTNITADCSIPANQTLSCYNGYYVGIHESSDIPSIVIDFGVEYGLVIISFVGVIVIGGLFIYGKKLLKR